MKASSLVIRAGPQARRILAQGWDWSHFDVLVGASGGPRWLVLSALDRMLVQILHAQKRSTPVHLLGSSSGAWRFLAYCHARPDEALRRLEQAYVDANWNHNRPLQSRGETARGILQACSAGDELYPLQQEKFRLHVVTAHCVGLLASESPWVQWLGMLVAAALTMWNRSRMGWLIRRALFSDPRDQLPALLDDVASRRWSLSPDNLGRVLLASGAIPLVLPGVHHVAGGPGGCLRDGGLVDYHFDRFRLQPQGLILYPHFAPLLWPSWLEHLHPKSAQDEEVLDRLVMIHPSSEWIASLPGGKLPGRNDAMQMSETERMARWHEATRRSQDLADDLESTVARVRPLPFAG